MGVSPLPCIHFHSSYVSLSGCMHADAYMRALVVNYNGYANDQHKYYVTTSYLIRFIQYKRQCHSIMFLSLDSICTNIMNRVLPSSFSDRASLHLLLH